jgi:hypothetical protein
LFYLGIGASANCAGSRTYVHYIRRLNPPRYELRPDATLADYNMEAQGDLLADYFALKYMRNTCVMRQRRDAGQLALYEQVLARFLADPRDPDHLPRGGARRFVRATASA